MPLEALASWCKQHAHGLGTAHMSTHRRDNSLLSVSATQWNSSGQLTWGPEHRADLCPKSGQPGLCEGTGLGHGLCPDLGLVIPSGFVKSMWYSSVHYKEYDLFRKVPPVTPPSKPAATGTLTTVPTLPPCPHVLSVKGTRRPHVAPVHPMTNAHVSSHVFRTSPPPT